VLSRAGHEDPFELSMEEQEKLIRQLNKEDYGLYETEVNFFLQHMEEKEQVKKLGGLHVIGSERHEARRIDNQLRGRAARQGDPGSSRFYLSMEDELMARFGGQQMEAVMTRLRVDETMPIANPMVDRIVEQSQNRVEGANFDVRKHLLEYDDVLNTQRAKIYGQRDLVFTKPDLSEDILEMLRIEVEERVDFFLGEDPVGDPGEAWRLLAWLSQTQPTLTFQDATMPSYTIHLLLDKVRESSPQLEKKDLPPILIDMAKKSLESEENYILDAVERIIEERQYRYQEQLETRIDTFDTFLEGISLGSDQPVNPQGVFNELRELVRTRLELNPAEIRELAEGPGIELEDKIRDQIEIQLLDLEMKRLIGGVERLMGAPLAENGVEIEEISWDAVRQWVVNKVRAEFQNRSNSYFDDPDDGRINKAIDSALNEIKSDQLSESQLINILGLMAEGRKAAYDKKSHKRIWLRTQRLRYTFYAGELLLEKDPESAGAEILEYLKNARDTVQEAWSKNEFARLKDIKLSSFDDRLQELIEDTIGEEAFLAALESPLNSLPEDLRHKVSTVLGRSVVSNISRDLFLRVISELWVEYLTEMEALRVAIGLEAYAQRDPLVQYKNRGFEMFQQLMDDMRKGVVNRMFTFQPRNLERILADVGDEAPVPKVI
jgi:preprotein translocase subunit SecA